MRKSGLGQSEVTIVRGLTYLTRQKIFVRVLGCGRETGQRCAMYRWYQYSLYLFCCFSFALLSSACLPTPALITGETGPQQPTIAPLIVTISQVSPPTEIVPSATATPSPPPTVTPTPTATLSPIVVPIMIYILDDEDGARSSTRKLSEIEEIFLRVNSIWAPAGIQFKLLGVERLIVPQALLTGMTRRDFGRFYDSINRGEVALPRFAPIVGFYVQDLGGPNGINPLGSNTFFVMDSPGVLDERVTAHEIGHIFGLHHALDNRNRLMFSGTNGMALTAEEIVVARYGAEGLLGGVR